MNHTVLELRSTKLANLDRDLTQLITRASAGNVTQDIQVAFRTISQECMIDPSINPSSVQFPAEFSLESAEMVHKAIQVAIALAAIIGVGALLGALFGGGSSGGAGGGGGGAAQAKDTATTVKNVAVSVQTPIPARTTNVAAVLTQNAAPVVSKAPKPEEPVPEAEVKQLVVEAFENKITPVAIPEPQKVTPAGRSKAEYSKTPERIEANKKTSSAVKEAIRKLLKLADGEKLSSDEDGFYDHIAQLLKKEQIEVKDILSSKDLLLKRKGLRLALLYPEFKKESTSVKEAADIILAVNEQLTLAMYWLRDTTEAIGKLSEKNATVENVSHLKGVERTLALPISEGNDFRIAVKQFLVEDIFKGNKAAIELLTASGTSLELYLTEADIEAGARPDPEAITVVNKAAWAITTLMSNPDFALLGTGDGDGKLLDTAAKSLTKYRAVVEADPEFKKSDRGQLGDKLAEAIGAIANIVKNITMYVGKNKHALKAFTDEYVEIVNEISNLQIRYAAWGVTHRSLSGMTSDKDDEEMERLKAKYPKELDVNIESMFGGRKFSKESDSGNTPEDVPGDAGLLPTVDDLMGAFLHQSPEQRQYDLLIAKEKQLNEAHAKVVAGVANEEDYKVLSSLALESGYGTHLRFNPRYISRAIATENIANMHKAVKIGLAVAALGVLAAIIRHFMKSKTEDGGGGEGGGAAAIEQINKPVTVKVAGASAQIPAMVANLSDIMKGGLSDDVARETFVKTASAELVKKYNGRIDEAAANQIAEKLYNVTVAMKNLYGTADAKAIPGYGEILKDYTSGVKVSQILANEAISSKWAFLKFPILYTDNLPANEDVLVDGRFEDYSSGVTDVLNISSGKGGGAWQGVDIAALIEAVAKDPNAWAAGDGKQNGPANFVANWSRSDTGSISNVINYGKMKQEDFELYTKRLREAFSPTTNFKPSVEQLTSALNDTKRLKAAYDLGAKVGLLKKTVSSVGDTIPTIEAILKRNDESGFAGKREALAKQTDDASKAGVVIMDQVAAAVRGWVESSKRIVMTLTGLTVSVVHLEKGLTETVKLITQVGVDISALESAINGAFNKVQGNPSEVTQTDPNGVNTTTESMFGVRTFSRESLQQVDPTHMPSMDPKEPDYQDGSDIRLPDGLDLGSFNDLDFTNMDDQEVFAAVDGVGEAQTDLGEDLIAVESIVGHMRSKGVSRGLIERLEERAPKLVTGKIPLNRFTSFESATHREYSLEVSEGLVKGMQIAGGILAAGLLVKMIAWIYDRFGRLGDTSKAVAGSIRDGGNNLEKAYKVLSDMSYLTFTDAKLMDAAKTKIGTAITGAVWDWNNNQTSFDAAKVLAFKTAFNNNSWCIQLQSFAESGKVNDSLLIDFDANMQSYVDASGKNLQAIQGFIDTAKGGTTGMTIASTPVDFSAALKISNQIQGKQVAAADESLKNLQMQMKDYCASAPVTNKAMLKPLDDAAAEKLVNQLRQQAPSLMKALDGRAAKKMDQLQAQATKVQASATKDLQGNKAALDSVNTALKQVNADIAIIGYITGSQTEVLNMFNRAASMFKQSSANVLAAVTAASAAGTKK